jgi:hypothetical protein
MKPYKGEIHNWRKVSCNFDGWPAPPFGAEGYFFIKGKPVGHPKFINWIVTSRVISIDKDGMCETLNSMYKLVGNEQ